MLMDRARGCERGQKHPGRRACGHRLPRICSTRGCCRDVEAGTSRKPRGITAPTQVGIPRLQPWGGRQETPRLSVVLVPDRNIGSAAIDGAPARTGGVKSRDWDQPGPCMKGQQWQISLLDRRWRRNPVSPSRKSARTSAPKLTTHLPPRFSCISKSTETRFGATSPYRPTSARLDMTIREQLLVAVDGYRGVEAADRLCAACAVLLDADGVAISLIFDGGPTGTLGSSSPRARMYDELQFTLGEGPCLDSMSGRAPVLIVDLTDPEERRW